MPGRLKKAGVPGTHPKRAKKSVGKQDQKDLTDLMNDDILNVFKEDDEMYEARYKPKRQDASSDKQKSVNMNKNSGDKSHNSNRGKS